MMWTVVVPINYGRECKTRLSARLTREQRAALIEVMACHVLNQLAAVSAVETVAVLSALRPPFAHGQWIEDRGRGLNDELGAVRTGFARTPLAFVHADLPFLAAEDVTRLLDAAAARGAAIAPDRVAQGTNGLAIADHRAFMPAFGPDSFALHRTALADAAIVRSPGLAFDLDDSKDLDDAIARGFVVPRG